MIALELINNVALVFLVVAVQHTVPKRWNPKGPATVVFSGLLYGAIGVISMMDALVVRPGYVIDGRSVILTIAGLFGGPWVAAIAAAICSAYRIWLGGIGVAAGLFTIVTSAALGVLFYCLRRRGFDVIRPLPLLVLGTLVHVLMLWAQAFWLGDAGLEVVRTLGLPIMVLYPVGVLLAAQMLFDHEEHLAMRDSLQEQTERLGAALDSVIQVVDNVVELRDPYTAGHQRRTARLAAAIAKSLGLPEAQVHDIEVAALLHDVGKIAVPAEVLARPGELSETERRLVEEHAEAGYRLLQSARMEDVIVDMIRQHHERCDGSGYPNGLTCDELLYGAKILMVADVVEAMSSHRPYRAAFGVDVALEEVRRGAGSLYDQGVVEACLDVFESGFEFE